MVTVLHKMTPDHLVRAHALSTSVRWPHRLEDWRLVLSIGDGIVAVDGDDLVGVAMYWHYGVAVARIGMVIVHPGRQGKGIGRLLMAAVLEQCAGRCIVLNATASGRPLYERLGFRSLRSVFQYQGIVRDMPHAKIAPGQRLRDATASDVNRLARIDAEAGGVSRSRVIEAMLVVGSALVLEQGGEPIGFAAVRTFGRGNLIGPVVAKSHADAIAMIGALLDRCVGAFLRIDIFDEHTIAGAIESCGLVCVDEVECMTLGSAPTSATDMRAFALFNQALG